jgi:WD40 repeat protein
LLGGVLPIATLVIVSVWVRGWWWDPKTWVLVGLVLGTYFAVLARTWRGAVVGPIGGALSGWAFWAITNAYHRNAHEMYFRETSPLFFLLLGALSGLMWRGWRPACSGLLRGLGGALAALLALRCGRHLTNYVGRPADLFVFPLLYSVGFLPLLAESRFTTLSKAERTEAGRLPAFTLRTLILFNLLVTSCWALWFHWGPWQTTAVLPHKYAVTSVAFSPEGTRVVTTVGFAPEAYIWNAESGALLVTLRDGQDRPEDAEFSRDGTRIVTAGLDGAARVWDANGGGLLAVMKGHTAAVLSVRFSPDGKQVMTSGAWPDSAVHIWDAVKSECIFSLPGRSNEVLEAAYSPDGRRIATVTYEDAAEVWDAATGARLVRVPGWFRSISFSPDGRTVVCATGRGAKVWQTETGTLVTEFAEAEDVYDARFSPDGKRVILAFDEKACIRNVETGERIAVLRGHKSLVTSAVFSPDGSRGATASWDRTVRIWRRYGRESVVGPLASPASWLTLVLLGGFIWSIRRDRIYFKAHDAKLAAEREARAAEKSAGRNRLSEW